MSLINIRFRKDFLFKLIIYLHTCRNLIYKTVKIRAVHYLINNIFIYPATLVYIYRKQIFKTSYKCDRLYIITYLSALLYFFKVCLVISVFKHKAAKFHLLLSNNYDSNYISGHCHKLFNLCQCSDFKQVILLRMLYLRVFLCNRKNILFAMHSFIYSFYRSFPANLKIHCRSGKYHDIP